ncbi:MAG: sigma 54-interacting transcriptional regulator [Syntrophobacteraceae bacterium]
MKDSRSPKGPEDLRKRAEECLKSEPDRPDIMCLEEANSLIHELRVHQIELEMQNEELRRAQNDLEISRSRHAGLYDFAPVGYLTLNKNGEIFDLNLTAARQLGIERGRLLDKRFQYFVLQPDKQEFFSHLNAIFNKRERRIAEVRLSPKDGEQFYARLESIYMEGEDGAGLCRTNMSDITERKLVEEDLRKSEERYRALVETSSDWVWEVDADAKYTYADPKAKKILGYEPEEIIGRTPFQLMPAEEAKRVGAIFAEIAANRSPFSSLINTNLHRNGQLVILETSGVPIFSPEGVFVGYRGMDRDVTERNRAEAELRESEERFRQLAENIREVFWIREHERLTYISPGYEEIFGLSREGLLKNPGSFLDIVHDEDKERVLRIHSEKHEEEVRSVQYRIIRPDGSVRWIYSRSFPILQDGEVIRTVGIADDITDRKRMEEQLQSRLREIEKLKKQLEQENISLREEVKLLSPHAEIIATSPAMQQVMVRVEQVAPTDSTVLITGETGTGKEVMARAIHALSTRKALALVTINCASLPPTLIESELFGRERGAFTGAMSRMMGRFEIADRSTLFLDEIGDLPLEVQAKLLRVLEEGRFERLGSTKSRQVNVRIIAATNRNLDHMVRTGKFRKDLYYRLNVFPIPIPPLRKRREDIPLLIWAFIRQFEKRMGRHINSIPNQSMEALLHYSWPGNARELRNVVEHAMIVSRGTVLEVRPPTLALEDIPEEAENLQDVQRRRILRVLEERGWRVSGRGGAAEILGLKPTTLEARMKNLGIRRPGS